MAFALTVHILDPDQTIKVSHIFWGGDEREARTYYEHHRQSCEYFEAAIREGRTSEIGQLVDEGQLP